MRVETVETKTIIYYFKQEEQSYLLHLGMWGYIKDRLKDNERIVIE